MNLIRQRYHISGYRRIRVTNVEYFSPIIILNASIMTIGMNFLTWGSSGCKPPDLSCQLRYWGLLTGRVTTSIPYLLLSLFPMTSTAFSDHIAGYPPDQGNPVSLGDGRQHVVHIPSTELKSLLSQKKKQRGGNYPCLLSPWFDLYA